MIVVDRTVFNVCQACSRRGKPYVPNLGSKPGAGGKKSAQPRLRQSPKRISMSDETILAPDFARLIREARMKMGLSHEQLGMRMNEKATLLKKIESGALKPDELFAKKLGRFLGVQLYENAAEDASESDQSPSRRMGGA